MKQAKYMIVILAILLMGFYGLAQANASSEPATSGGEIALNQGGGVCSDGSTPISTTYDFTDGAQGWTGAFSTTGSITATWVLTTTNPPTSTTNSPSAGNRMFTPDFEGEGAGYFHEAYLISPEFGVPTGTVSNTLTFWNYQEFEIADTQCWDSGLVEYSTDGGSTWAQFQDADLPGNPYDNTIHSEYAGVTRLGEAPAWCPDTPAPGGDGTTGFRDWEEYTVDLTDLAGQNVTFRFTFFVDNTAPGYGWQVDDISTTTCPVAPTAVSLNTITAGTSLPIFPMVALGLLGLATAGLIARRIRR